MDDIVDYSKKLNEETKKIKKIFIIIIVIVTFFAFSIGFYLSYAFNEDAKHSNYKSKFDTIYSILKDDWYYGVDDEQIERTLIDKAIYGMLDTQKDPFTRYLTSLGSLADKYEGLGITIVEYEKHFLITDVTSKINIDAGLRANDILLKIGDTDLSEKSMDDLKELLKNKETVKLLIKRGEENITIDAFITTYTPVTVFKDYSKSSTVAYIRISEFANETSKELETILKEVKEKKYNELIIDLRDNPGGYIDSVVDCADLFLSKNKSVLMTKDKHDNEYQYKTRSDNKYDFSKITIIINENSASGAEAFPAALNENIDDVVKLVGVKTYGKGSAQKIIQFDDGTYFNYTYALWYTPSGSTIHKNGVSPEISYSGSGIHLLDFNKVSLKENDYGQEVYNLQVIMKELNYYNGALNSFYSSELKEAVKAYQLSNHLDQSGELDAITIRYILAKIYNDKIKDYDDEINWVINNYE